MSNIILERTIELVKDRLKPEIDTITVERAVLGLFFTGVKHRSRRPVLYSCKRNAGGCMLPKLRKGNAAFGQAVRQTGFGLS